MTLDDLIKKYESWKEHASDEIELAYVTLFLVNKYKSIRASDTRAQNKKAGVLQDRLSLMKQKYI